MKRTHVPGRGAALVAVAIAAVLLAGCKGEVLDYRNAQMVNGKVYDGSANEPFSGKLTNVPDRSLLIEQAGLQLAGKLASIALVDSLPASERNAQSFLGRSGAEILLSGAVCDVQIEGGVPDGSAVCKAPQSDLVRIETSFKHGALNGPLKLSGGQNEGPLLEATFNNGQLDGTEKVYSWTDHKLIHTFPWNKGSASGSEEAFDPNTGAVVKRATFVDGKYEGEVVHYAPDGKQVTLRATYVNGKLNGPYEEWDASGTLIADKAFSNGVEVGADRSDVGACVNEWDNAYRAVPGRPAFPPAELQSQWKALCRAGTHPSASDSGIPGAALSSEKHAPGGCVEAWTAAYRLENGADAMVTDDRIGEWNSWCKVGKWPS